jgi:hypothetical protein
MIGEQFRTFFWLRWRLRVNQLKHDGAANRIILGVLAVGAVLLALALFVLLFLAGRELLSGSTPSALLFTWDVAVGVFFFSWFTGLMHDLQRSDALSLGKFLHLPVSLSGAYLINYLGSLFSLTLLWFVPAALGLIVGMAVDRGPAMLLLLPLLAAFLFMVTAVTHQFRGWLAALMANKRRRQTILFVVPAIFVLLVNLPSIINVLRPWNTPEVRTQQMDSQKAELDRALAAHEITAQEHQERLAALQHDNEVQIAEENRQHQERTEQTFWLVNVALPPGWLPLGAQGLAEGKFLPVLLGTLGLTLIGAASLRRSYRTTLRIYTGQFSAGGGRTATPAAPAKVEPAPASLLLEKKLPWLPEQAAAVTLGSFRSLLRTPELRMGLLSSIIGAVVCVAFMGKGATAASAGLPLLAFSAMALLLLGTVWLMANQFGCDRNGFDVYVLSGAPRRDILLGKNLAFAPFPLGLGLLVAVVLQVFLPMRLDHFLAVPAQFLSMYLLACLPGNWVSIVSPVRVPPGTMHASKMSGFDILLRVFYGLVLLPLALGLTILPFLAERLLASWGWMTGVPVHLLLSLVGGVAVVFFYLLVLGWQGRLLQSREQKILAVVRTKAE